jgi:hypothetical protein
MPPQQTLRIMQLYNANWQEWRDSNPRPSVLETDALPTELHSYVRWLARLTIRCVWRKRNIKPPRRD